MAKSRRTPFDNLHGRNDRFRYEKLATDEGLKFVKTAQDVELRPSLEREIVWTEFMRHVSRRFPDAKLRGVAIDGYDEAGGLVMEYIDAPLVAKPDDVQAWMAEIDRYAAMLHTLDVAADGYVTSHPEPDSSSLRGMQAIERAWRRWFGERYDQLPSVEKAYDVVADALPGLTLCMQHGDLTPWQIFQDRDEWILYDGEKSGTHLPRYNDLAYGFARLYTRLKSPESAKLLLEKFLDVSGRKRDTFMREFLPVLVFIAVGTLADAYADLARNDYLSYAERLLDAALQGELSEFVLWSSPSSASKTP